MNKYEEISMRKSAKRINLLDPDLPIDEDDQEEILEFIRIETISTNKLFINIFTIIYLIPTPILINIKYFRQDNNSLISFWSIISLILSIIKIRYLHVLNFQEDRILSKLLKYPLVLDLINISISGYVTLQRLSWGNGLNIVYYFPLLASLSSILLMYWILDFETDIKNLGNLKYKYKSA